MAMKRKKTPTIKDVANLAGVSIATVSRVLNNLGVVNPDTKQKVLDAVTLLNYQPNAVARSLKLAKTKSIGVLLPEISNNFFTQIVEQLEQLLSPKGYALLVCSSENSVEEEKRKLAFLLERSVDGLLVVPVSDVGEHFAESTIPLVMLDRKIASLQRDVVISDNYQSAFEITNALIADGHTQIGFLGGDPHVHTSVERYRGYADALNTQGLPIDPRFVLHKGMTMKSGYTLMEDALKQADHPDAFFVVNDMVHIGATLYLTTHASREVRQRIVFASFDYLYYAPLLRYCRYAAAQPIEEMANSAVQLLTRRLEGDSVDFPSTQIFKPTVVVMGKEGADGEEILRHPPRFEKEFS